LIIDIIGLLELKINLIINIGAKLRRPWPVIETMSFAIVIHIMLLM